MTPATAMPRAAQALLLVLAVVGCLVVLQVVWPDATGQAWKRLDRAAPAVVGWALLLGVAGVLGSHVMRALRLRAEWQRRCGADWWACWRVTLLHSAAINVLPLRSGELGFPLLLRRLWGVPLAAAAFSLVCMRLQDMVVLAWLGAGAAAAVVWVQAASGHGTTWLAAWVSLPALTMTVVLLALVARCVRADAQNTRTFGLDPGPDEWSRRGWQAALSAVTPASWGWCTANWVVKLGTLGGWMAWWTEAPALQGWCAAWAGEVAAALPVQAPAGFGSYEAAASLGAWLAGVPGGWEPADAASMAAWPAGAASMPDWLLAALAAHVLALAVTLLAAAGVAVAAHDRRPAVLQSGLPPPSA